MSEGDHLLQVHGRRDALGQSIHGGHCVIALVGRDESEVPGRSDDAVVAEQRSQDRQPRAFESTDDLVGMPLGAGLVQDHAYDANGRVPCHHPVHRRGD